MSEKLNRRNFLTRTALASAAVGTLHADESTGTALAPNAVLPGSKGTMPTGKIGKRTVSRIISGGNLICSQQGIEPDYFFKTFHHDRYWSATPKKNRKRFCVDGPRSQDHNESHDNIFCIDPEETIEFMAEK